MHGKNEEKNWKLQVNNSHRWTLNIDDGKNGIECSNGQTRIQCHRVHSHSATLICSLIFRLAFFYQTKAHIFIVNLFYLFCAIRLSFALRCLWLCFCCCCSCSCSTRFECSTKWLEKWNVHCLLMFVWFVHLCLSRTQVSESRKCLSICYGKTQKQRNPTTKKLVGSFECHNNTVVVSTAAAAATIEEHSAAAATTIVPALPLKMYSLSLRYFISTRNNFVEQIVNMKRTKNQPKKKFHDNT